MFVDSRPSPYDLNFKLLGIPVRIHPLFWLISAMLGWSWMRLGLEYVAIWILCVMVSILIHEMGHVLVGAFYGNRDGHIILYGFGGLAVSSAGLRDWWKRVFVSLAGPFAGFAFLAALLVMLYMVFPVFFVLQVQDILDTFYIPINLERMVASREMPNTSPLVLAAFQNLIFINFYWGVLNLLPIWPLDGGQVMGDTLSHFLPRNGLNIAMGLSFTIAGLLCIHCLLFHYRGAGLIPILRFGSPYMALLFGLLALQSFQQFQSSRRDPYDPWMGEGRPWDRNRDW